MWSTLWFLLFFGSMSALFGGLIAHAVHRRQLLHDAFVALGREFGLKVDGGGILAEALATGTIDGVDVTIDLERYGSGKNRTVYTRVRASGGVSARIGIRPNSLATVIDKALGGQDLRIGDPPFDDKLVISCVDPVEVRALLDAQARDAVLACVEEGGKLGGGVWTVMVRGHVTNVDKLRRLLLATAGAARAMRDDGRTVQERLAAVVEHDPVDEVRLAALRALGDGADPGWLLGLATGSDPRIGVVAAQALGAVGEELRIGFLGSSDPWVRRFAALSLVARGDVRVEEALIACLEADPADEAVIEALAATGTARSVPALEAAASRGLGIPAAARGARAALRSIGAGVRGGGHPG